MCNTSCGVLNSGQARPDVRHVRAQRHGRAPEQCRIAGAVAVAVDLAHQGELAPTQQSAQIADLCCELKSAGVIEYESHIAWRNRFEGKTAVMAQSGVHVGRRAEHIGTCTVNPV